MSYRSARPRAFYYVPPMASGLKAKYTPTQEERERVKKMAAFRLKVDEMRQLVLNPATGKPLSDKTFEREFNRELSNGRAAISFDVKQNLARIASTGSSPAAVAAIKLWLTLIEGHRNPNNEVTGANGGPIQIEDVTKLSDDERAARVAAIIAGAAIRARKAAADDEAEDDGEANDDA